MKRLLLVIAGFSVIGATAQEARVDLGRNAEMYVANHADGIPYNTSANKQSSSVAIGTAPNVYGTGFGPKTNIWADEDLNTVAFLHRSDYNSNGDNSSGSLRFDYSTDGGATWTANAGPIYNPNLSGYAYPGFARYPHIGILNESGNTNPLNASISVWAPTLVGINGGAWGGALMGTHKMDNTTTNMSVDTASGHLTLENSYVDGGTFWGVSLDHPDYQNTEYTDTAIIWKGSMDWNTDSMTYTEHKAYLPASFITFDDGTTGKIYGDGRIFFASNKTTGYISMEGYDSTFSSGRVIHPYIIKTTNGGANWSSPMGPDLDLLVDNGSGDSLVDIFDMITGGWDIGHLTSSTRGHDLAVDANGNPHMFIHVFPGPGTTPTGGTTAGEFTYYPAVNLLVDVFTTDGGLTWECNIISQVFTFSYDFDATNGPVPEANRPYISMNASRDMMFFSWFETDTTFSSGTSDNQFPDWRCQGYNVTGDSLEGPMTVMGTYGDATWGNVADWAFDNGDGTHQLHMTYGPIEDFGSFSVLNPIDFYYLGQPYPNNIGLEELELNNFSVSQNYPNPTDALTKIAIEAAAPAQFNLSIVDLTGRLIMNEDLGLLNEGRHIHTIDASNFASGIYFYTVQSGDYSITKKLIVE